MILDSDQQDSLKQYVDDIIADYQERDFDLEQFHAFIFALYEQSQTLDDFSEISNSELVDFFGDNTENFVSDLINFIQLNIEIVHGNPNENKLSRHASVVNNNEDKDGHSDYHSRDDDDIGDDDDDEKDTNYRRRRKQSDEDDEEENPKPKYSQPHQSHSSHHQSHDRKDKKPYDKRDSNQHKDKDRNKGDKKDKHSSKHGQQQQPHQPAPSHQMPKPVPQPGQMPVYPGQQMQYPPNYPYQAGVNPYMNPSGQQWGPGYYSYPQQGYMPPQYPQGMYPYDQPQQPHPQQPGHHAPVQPPVSKPETKKAEYDPLNPEQKRPPPKQPDATPPKPISQPTSQPSQPPTQRNNNHNNSNNNHHNGGGSGAGPTGPGQSKSFKDMTGEKRGQPRRDDHSEERKVHKVHVGEKDGQKSITPSNFVPNEGPNKGNTIYIKNIPDYYNNLEALNKQFKRYGPITNIKVDLKNKFTTIEFLKPKHAKSALTNKSPLFGNKDILVTADPNMTIEEESKQNKLETVLMDRLKFLIQIKKYVQDHHKNYIMTLINHVKNAQKTKEQNPTVQSLVGYELFDLNVDFTLAIAEVDFTQKVIIQKKVENFGKLESFKPNPIEKSLEIKYFDIKDAQRAKGDLGSEYNIEFKNKEVIGFIENIEKFEDFLMVTKKKEES